MEKSRQTVKERLLLFLQSLGLSQKRFETACGLANGYVNNIRRSISPEKLQIIARQYPQLNTVWLLTGEGEMTNDTPLPAVVEAPLDLTPYYILKVPTSAMAGSLGDYAASVHEYECERIVSPVKGIDFAITVTGESMAPEYPNGSLALIKKINEKAFIAWGEVYVLDTVNGTVIKKVNPSDKGEEYIRCISINPDFAPYDICRSDVYGIYKVVVCMSMK